VPLARPTTMFKNTFVLKFTTPDNTTSIQLPGTKHYLLLQEWNFITATTQDAMSLFHIPKEATVQAACRITYINSGLQKRTVVQFGT